MGYIQIAPRRARGLRYTGDICVCAYPSCKDINASRLRSCRLWLVAPLTECVAGVYLRRAPEYV
eukprot:scaffold249772_cov30-Prasinocladus_malaysianus.AAC.1